MFARSLGASAYINPIGLGLAAAIPGFALIGERTRPWMMVPAAIAFALTVFVLIPYLDIFLAVAANVPYAAILLYGTRRVEKCRHVTRYG